MRRQSLTCLLLGIALLASGVYLLGRKLSDWGREYLPPSVVRAAEPTENAPQAERAEDPQPAVPTDADFTGHVDDLKEQFGEDGWTYCIEKPFVVVGNEKPSVVRRRAERTVRWAVNLLKKAYFQRDPDHIITIWLLGDAESYTAHAKRIIGREPTTPYGFYSPSSGIMVMNIATGGGTLVHEIVHPFVAANFPACPAWFNEGLGSLYEQASQRDGQIVGRTNWRLAGLQKAIRDGKVPKFKDLTATTTDEFYGPGCGVHYAQARYLCYYLQEKGLLREFYHAFHENHKDDPTGYDTLREILGDPDMDEFQDEWEDFCLELRFPER